MHVDRAVRANSLECVMGVIVLCRPAVNSTVSARLFAVAAEPTGDFHALRTPRDLASSVHCSAIEF